MILQPKRRLVPLLALATVTLPFVLSASVQAAEPIPAPVPEMPPPGTYTDAQGLKVTPLDTEPNDLADILQVQMWNFKVEMPKPGQIVNCTLEVRQLGEKGQPDKVLDTLNEMSVGPIYKGNPTPKDDYSNMRALVAFYKERDEEGNLWSSYVRVANSSGTGATRVFKGFYAGGIDSRPQHQEDGSFLLARYGKKTWSTFPAPGELTLIMRFKLVTRAEDTPPA